MPAAKGSARTPLGPKFKVYVTDKGNFLESHFIQCQVLVAIQFLIFVSFTSPMPAPQPASPSLATLMGPLVSVLQTAGTAGTAGGVAAGGAGAAGAAGVVAPVVAGTAPAAVPAMMAMTSFLPGLGLGCSPEAF